MVILLCAPVLSRRAPRVGHRKAGISPCHFTCEECKDYVYTVQIARFQDPFHPAPNIIPDSGRGKVWLLRHGLSADDDNSSKVALREVESDFLVEACETSIVR